MQIDIPRITAGADNHDIIGMGQVQLPAFFAQGNPVFVGGLWFAGHCRHHLSTWVLLIADKNLLFGKRYRKNWPCVSSQIQPHDVVGATHWLELKAGARIGAGAETVIGGFDLVRRAEKWRKFG